MLKFFHLAADSIIRFGLRVWNLGEDDVDVHLPAARCAFVQIPFGVQGKWLIRVFRRIESRSFPIGGTMSKGSHPLPTKPALPYRRSLPRNGERSWEVFERENQ